MLFLFLVPCFVFFLINNYLPMTGIYFAFTQFNFRDHLFASPFVGFKNFEFLVRSEILHLTQNTILYNIVFIVVGNVLQIFFAILISHVNRQRLRKLSQTMIFMPYFVSYVILRVLVFNMFEYEVGLVNSFVTSLGMERIDFAAALEQGEPYIRQEVDRLLEQGILTPEEREAIRPEHLVEFFGTEIGARAAKAPMLCREKEFLLQKEIEGMPTIVQGVIDCYFEDEQGLVLIDYNKQKADGEG